MKFSFEALLVKILWRIFGKLVEKGLSEVNPRVLADEMRRNIEGWSDKTIDEGISQIKEGNYSGLEDAINSIQRAGISCDMMLQWLEDEKFLREHRRKYHPESG